MNPDCPHDCFLWDAGLNGSGVVSKRCKFQLQAMGGAGLGWRLLADLPRSQASLSLEPLNCSSPFKALREALEVSCSSFCIHFLSAAEASGLIKLNPVLGGSHWNPSLMSMSPVCVF